MQTQDNPYEASQQGTIGESRAPSFVNRVFVYLILVFSGVVIGSFVSVLVGDAWYPDDADGAYVVDTISAVMSSPIAMTFGLFPSLGFYGPWHGLLMLLGMLLTSAGTWLHFRSHRFSYAWLAFIGAILWSHNNYLGFAAIMSV